MNNKLTGTMNIQEKEIRVMRINNEDYISFLYGKNYLIRILN